MLSITLKGIEKAAKDIERWADRKAKEITKAMSLALSKEGYRVYQKARQDLKTGALGLEPKAVYRNEPGSKKYRRRAKDKRPPLSKIFSGITYQIDRRKLHLEVGFRAVTPGTKWQARIAEKSLKGYTWLIRDKSRLALHKIGIHLRRTTTSVRVPARDIMGVVLEREGSRMLINIKDNFRRKMAGERI